MGKGRQKLCRSIQEDAFRLKSFVKLFELYEIEGLKGLAT